MEQIAEEKQTPEQQKTRKKNTTNPNRGKKTTITNTGK